MVDLAVALYGRGHKGRIVALSRHGLLPRAHRGFESYESFFVEIRESKRILDIFKTVRKHLDRAKAMWIDERAVIDSLRPDTQTLWRAVQPTKSAGFCGISFVTGRSFAAGFRRRATPLWPRCVTPGSSA